MGLPSGYWRGDNRLRLGCLIAAGSGSVFVGQKYVYLNTYHEDTNGVKFCAEEGGLKSWERCGGSGVDWRRGEVVWEFVMVSPWVVKGPTVLVLIGLNVLELYKNSPPTCIYQLQEYSFLVQLCFFPLSSLDPETEAFCPWYPNHYCWDKACFNITYLISHIQQKTSREAAKYMANGGIIGVMSTVTYELFVLNFKLGLI
uniref:Uncharacterized protein n=1 Tax=Tanacetum cinerariifolium TaxID=118510 RepID=A0A6L2JMU2_TANCI|nr:hypothetical protein [Tanacetum cinerariifolium]